MFRASIAIILFLSLSNCSPRNVSNFCDADSDVFLNELLFRLTTEDKSSHCGYKLTIPNSPICGRSYDVTHLPENWEDVKKEVESQFALGSSGPETLVQYSPDSVSAAISSGYPAFQSALSAPNGKVYLLPYNSPNIVSIDPNNRSYALSTSVPGLVDFIGGILGPQGKIYLAPHQNNDFFEFNTANESMTTIGNVTMGGASYNGGIFAPNGKIYFTPGNESIIRYYDLNTKTIGQVSTPVSGGIFSNAVLTPEGKIYFIPHDATNIHILDTKDDSVTVHPSAIGGSGGYFSGVYAPNGKIYIIPYNAATLYVLDTKNNDTLTSLGNIPASTTGMFNGAILSPNGKIYLIPYNYANFASIDTRNDQLSILMANPATNSYRGGAIGRGGEIYLSPHNVNRFDLLDTHSNGSFCDSIKLSPYWNKF
ncbi:hypothetical protein EHQ59_17560 [Leptospira kemamanensis]|uniref:Uncharacterized protein n=1 Tax=Leptospira kemamanensis TaxID=2484942 RepID=A0A4V3JPS0_9LEPT|nr:hypothetical protein [Leptospira kemamanensis]TGL46836.1 hypothetical protein EHQ59_17560 [Leptospira kemamanensis]